jgi:hypothetical protein
MAMAHVLGYVGIALAVPLLLWLFATGGTRQGIQAVFATWTTAWRRSSFPRRGLLLLGPLCGWGITVVLSALWPPRGPGTDWSFGIRQGAVLVPFFLSLLVLGPRFSGRYGDGRHR